MAYDVWVDESARTIFIRGSGSATTEDTLRMIGESEQIFRENSGFHVLYDSRNLRIESSSADMMKVAELLFDQMKASFGRFAIVVPEERVAFGRVFCALAHPHGLNANVFTDLDDARKWLGIRPGV